MTPTSNLSMKVQIIRHALNFYGAKWGKIWVFSLDVHGVHNYWFWPHVSLIWFEGSTMLMCYIYNLKYIYIAGFFVRIQIVYKWDYCSAFVSAISFLLRIPRILEMNRTLGTCCDWVSAALMTIRMRLVMRLLRFVVGCIIGVMGQQSYIKTLIMAKYHNQRDRRRKPRTIMEMLQLAPSQHKTVHIPISLSIYGIFILSFFLRQV